MTNNQAIESIKSIGATSESAYVSTNLGISPSNEETQGIISSTFGVLKQSLEAFWYATGLDPNVNNAIANTMNDPNQYMEIQGKKFYPHTGVGRIQAYNEMGNPSGGCFTLHTMG